MLFNEEIRLMRDRYADYLLNIEQRPKWRRNLMDFHWRCRSQVYGLLEKPKTPLSVCYHIAVFLYILIVHTWSSLISQTAITEKHVNLLASLEKAIAFYFLIEFLLRIWSAGADNRFQSWKGRKKFLLQPMCIVDTLILSLAITAVLLAEYKYSGRFMDVLRFIQILRFFHIDRQMVSWTLLRNFIKHSSFELISIYYITSFVIALMASVVFTLESNEAQGGLIPNSENATFSNYGEAFWFSAVSVFTIGYGDIVPERALTKILVCIFSYMGLIMFGAASTLVGVGLSLMLDHRNKEQKETKLRNLAATTIQIWYRYHLATNEQTFNNIPIYATFCVNLNRYELKQQKMNARRVANAGQKQHRRKKKFFINSATDNNLTISSPYELTHAFRSYIVPTIFVSSSEINEDLDRESTYSLPRPETNSELSELQLFARRIATENQRRRGSGTTMNLVKPEKRRRRISLAKFLQSRKVRSGSQHQNEESFESTSDYQPDGLDYGSADERSMGSCITLSENVSLSSSAMPVLTTKNQTTLRLLHYLRFVVVRRRFKRARMPYELDDAEAELCDLEHKRMRAFKQLEKQYAQLIGKKFEREGSDENGNQLMNQKTMLARVDECENYLAKIETKVNKLEETLIKLMEVIQQKNGEEHVNYSDSSPDTFALQVPFRSPKSAQ